MQEAAQKDVERAFRVLQTQFAILAQPALKWSVDKLHLVMKTCIILHNMIVEDERNLNIDHIYNSNTSTGHDSSFDLINPISQCYPNFSTFIQNTQRIRNTDLHFSLPNNLIAHLWDVKPPSSVGFCKALSQLVT
jgi:hypothetical protein